MRRSSELRSLYPTSFSNTRVAPVEVRPGGLPYKSDGYARRKIQVKPLRETIVGVAQA